MGSFSEYKDTGELVAAWEGPKVERQATQEELDHLFGRKRKPDLPVNHYSNNKDFGQF